MKRISLTQGQFAIVDDKDFEWLNKWNWCAQWFKRTQNYYAVRCSWNNGKQQLVYMAREILGLEKGNKLQSDHVNHNTLNNQQSNLRTVTVQQNQFNEKSPKGYYWNKNAQKYQASIKVNYKTIYLGLFNSPKQAHIAYLQAKKVLHKI